MDAGIRRQEILDRLAATRRPLAATRLGAQLGVSRQVIVGDVALLRAEGHPIRATNRGYVLARPATRPHRSIFVQHTREDIAIELSAIIKVGGSVLDVSVEHRLYGQITVDLLIRSPEDLAHFLARLPPVHGPVRVDQRLAHPHHRGRRRGRPRCGRGPDGGTRLPAVAPRPFPAAHSPTPQATPASVTRIPPMCHDTDGIRGIGCQVS